MDKPKIRNINEQFVQLFLSDRLQLGDVLEQLLEFTGPARITVSTFSTGEEFLARLHKLEQQHMVIHARLYCDFKAAEKTARIKDMLQRVYNEVFLVANHSKVMIVEGIRDTALVLTSQNQTRGNRVESYAIFSLPAEAERIKEQLQQIPSTQII